MPQKTDDAEMLLCGLGRLIFFIVMATIVVSRINVLFPDIHLTGWAVIIGALAVIVLVSIRPANFITTRWAIAAERSEG